MATVVREIAAWDRWPVVEALRPRIEARARRQLAGRGVGRDTVERLIDECWALLQDHVLGIAGSGSLMRSMSEIDVGAPEEVEARTVALLAYTLTLITVSEARSPRFGAHSLDDALELHHEGISVEHAALGRVSAREILGEIRKASPDAIAIANAQIAGMATAAAQQEALGLSDRDVRKGRQELAMMRARVRERCGAVIIVLTGVFSGRKLVAPGSAEAATVAVGAGGGAVGVKVAAVIAAGAVAASGAAVVAVPQKQAPAALTTQVSRSVAPVVSTAVTRSNERAIVITKSQTATRAKAAQKTSGSSRKTAAKSAQPAPTEERAEAPATASSAPSALPSAVAPVSKAPATPAAQEFGVPSDDGGGETSSPASSEFR